MRFNPFLERLTPYRSGPPLAEIRRCYDLHEMAVLSANECGQGPFPEVIDALGAALGSLNRYPDGGCGELRSSLAVLLGVPESWLVFGNGSCELLMLLGETLLGIDKHVVFPDPSFVMYRAIALSRGGQFSAVALPGLDYDLGAMLAAINPDTSMVIVCNPNNPTGGYIKPVALRAFLDDVPEDVVVVLDEAYQEFVTDEEHEDIVHWVATRPNLIVLRTFSKIYGLAGLRIGYGVAQPPLIEALDKVRQPFNVDSLAQVAALTSLAQPVRLEERRRQVASERTRVAKALAEWGVVAKPSQANFLLVDVTGLKIPGPEVAQSLLEGGVLTRSGYAMGCPGWTRVTIGEPRDNDLFLAQMRHLTQEGESLGIAHGCTGLDAEALSPES